MGWSIAVLIFLVVCLAIPLALVSFKWLMDSFEGDNPRNTWRVASITVLGAVAVAYLFAVLVREQSWWVQTIVGTVLYPLACGAMVRLAYGLRSVRSLALGSGLPLAWGLALASALLASATLQGMLQRSPVLTVLLLGSAGWTLYSLRRRNALISRKLFEMTSWLGC